MPAGGVLGISKNTAIEQLLHDCAEDLRQMA